MDGVPPRFYFVIANSQEQSLISSTVDEATVSYLAAGTLTKPINYTAFKTLPGDPINFIFSDGYMALKSEDGIKTFYLTFKGKTDTLGLDIRRVRVTPDNGGNSTPIVTFNGRPVPPTQGTPDFPDYFVLKRR